MERYLLIGRESGGYVVMLIPATKRASPLVLCIWTVPLRLCGEMVEASVCNRTMRDSGGLLTLKEPHSKTEGLPRRQTEGP